MIVFLILYFSLFVYLSLYILRCGEKAWMAQWLLLDSDALDFYARILWKSLDSNS